MTLNNKTDINRLVKENSSIPSDGDMMISFGPDAEYIVLKFVAEEETVSISVINKKWKTPSTGFNSKKSELEKELCQRIEQLLTAGNISL